MLKDVRLCLEEGQALGVPFPSAAYTREILTAAMGLGHAEDDFAALIEPSRWTSAAGTELHATTARRHGRSRDYGSRSFNPPQRTEP